MSDLIKREDAIEELADYMYEIALLKADGRLDTMEHYLNRAKAMLKRIPSADRPQGEWVDAEIPLESGDTMPIQVCNLCKTFYPLAYTGGGHRFCPNCGARMKDVTEGLESRTDLIWYGDKTDLIGDETGRHTGWFGKGADDED